MNESPSPPGTQQGALLEPVGVQRGKRRSMSDSNSAAVMFALGLAKRSTSRPAATSPPLHLAAGDDQEIFRAPFDFEQSGPTISPWASARADRHSGQLVVSALTIFSIPDVSAYASASAALGVALAPTGHGLVTVSCSATYEGGHQTGGTSSGYGNCALTLTALEGSGASVVGHAEESLWSDDGTGSTEQGSANDLMVSFAARAQHEYHIFLRASVSASPSVIVSTTGPGDPSALATFGAASGNLRVTVECFRVRFSRV